MYCIRSAARLGQRLSPSLRNVTTSASLRVRKSENFTKYKAMTNVGHLQKIMRAGLMDAARRAGLRVAAHAACEGGGPVWRDRSRNASVACDDGICC